MAGGADPHAAGFGRHWLGAKANAHLRAEDLTLVYNVSSIPGALMFAALNQQDFLCRIFGACLAGPVLDMEVGDMCGKAGPATPKLFTYMRYNAELSGSAWRSWA